MTTIPTHAHPHLRLVGVDDGWEAAAQRPRQVAAENRAAAANTSLDPTDPRWVLAARAYSQLQGTALTWDRRQRVMQSARRLGVRAFDANLIIAIVQDQVRRGRSLDDAARSVSLLDPPAARRGRGRVLGRWIAAVTAALAANALLIWWLMQ